MPVPLQARDRVQMSTFFFFLKRTLNEKAFWLRVLTHFISSRLVVTLAALLLPMQYLSRIVIVLSMVSLFTDMASEMLYPVLPIYLKSIGFSILLIGILCKPAG